MTRRFKVDDYVRITRHGVDIGQVLEVSDNPSEELAYRVNSIYTKGAWYAENELTLVRIIDANPKFAVGDEVMDEHGYTYKVKRVYPGGLEPDNVEIQRGDRNFKKVRKADQLTLCRKATDKS